MNRNRLAWGALLATAGASVIVGVQPAAAAQVSFRTTCTPPAGVGLGIVHGTSIADITSSNSAPKAGDTITLSWQTVQAASNNPGLIDLSANVVKPLGTIAMSGADSGTVAVQGPMINPPIPKNSPMKLSTMTGTVTLPHAGTVTFRPAGYTIRVLGTDTVCVADAGAPVVLTLTVGAGSGSTGSTSAGTTGGSTSGTAGGTSGGTSGSTSGGTTGGTSGGTSGSSTTGGNLASTGGDSATVGALGLLGGTVLLVGAAVVVLTPWRRLRNQR